MYFGLVWFDPFLAQISERPLVYMMDTPGVMFPNVTCPDAGLKLALTGAIRDEVGRTFLTLRDGRRRPPTSMYVVGLLL